MFVKGLIQHTVFLSFEKAYLNFYMFRIRGFFPDPDQTFFLSPDPDQPKIRIRSEKIRFRIREKNVVKLR